MHEIRMTAIRNYEYFTRRIGFHKYRSILRQALQMEKETGRSPTGRFPDRDDDRKRDFSLPQGSNLIKRIFNERVYRGREFSSLIAEDIPMSEKHARLRRGDFGDYRVEGLREDVLSIIARRSWDELADFQDDAVEFENERGSRNVTVFGDGFVLEEMSVDDPESREARDIMASLGYEGS